MKRLIISLLLVSGTLAAGAHPEVSFDLFTKPSGTTSVATGNYSEVQVDLTVNCAEPIHIHRWYSTAKEKDGHCGHWVVQTDVIHADVGAINETLDILWEGEDGAGAHFNAVKEWSFVGNPARWQAEIKEIPKGYTNIGGRTLSAATNIRGLGLAFDRDTYRWTLTKGDGERRIYSHYGKRVHGVKHHKNGGEFFHIAEVRRPNGNRLFYSYDEHHRLKRVESTNAERTVLFGWVDVTWTDRRMELVASDGQTCTYEYATFCVCDFDVDIRDALLQRVHLPDGRVEQLSYTFEKENPKPFSLARTADGQGHSHAVDYYGTQTKRLADRDVELRGKCDLRINKVLQELRPIGYDGTLLPCAQYYYRPDATQTYFEWTHVLDAHGECTHYDFDRQHLLRRIKRFKDGADNRCEEFLWGTDESNRGNLVQRRVVADGRALVHHQYTYDERGNVTTEGLVGDLTGGGKTECYQRNLSYSQDSFNLILRDETPAQTVVYDYLANTNLVRAKLVYANQHLQERQFFAYDDNAQQVLAIEDDGSDEDPNSLCGVTYRRTTRTTYNASGLPASVEKTYLENGVEHLLGRIHLHYDHCNRVVREEVCDADGNDAYALTRAYDGAGRVVSETNALGEEERFLYDARGNLIEQRKPLATHRTCCRYDFSDRLVSTETIGDDVHLAVHFRYDLLGQVVEQSDMCGNSTHYTYDPFGNIIEERQAPIRTPDGWEAPIIRRSYDALDRMTEETDGRGCTTRRAYTARGDLSAIHFPDGTSETFSYDLSGRLICAVDRNGTRTTYTRDYRDRLLTTDIYSAQGEHLAHREIRYKGELKVAEVDANGTETHYRYDGAGRLIEETRADTYRSYAYDALGRRACEREWFGYGEQDYTATHWEYDLLDRVVREEIRDVDQTLHSRTDFTYDIDGNRTREIRWISNNQHSTTTLAYDCMGNPIQTTDALGHITTTHYERGALLNGQPHLLQIDIDPLGCQTLTYRDPRRNTIRLEKRDPLGQLLHQTDHTYDLAGNCLAQTHRVLAPNCPERQVENRWEYDAAGHITQLTEGAGTAEQRTTRFRYNANGDLEKTYRPDGQTITFTYDALGRIATRAGLHLDDTYRYDSNGNLIQIHSLCGQTTRIYDASNRLVEETLATGYTLCYTYDRQGRRTRLTLPDGSAVAYTYDATHLLSVTRLDPQNTQHYTHAYTSYDLLGNKLTETLAGSCGTRTTTYDAAGRITALQTLPYTSDLTYDPAGNLTTLTQTETPEPPILCDVAGSCITLFPCHTYTTDFTYDSLHQIASENSDTYTHDSLHNRTAHNDHTYTLNALNQPTHLTYDSQGCLLTVDDTTLTYDALNRLISATNSTTHTTYTYDAYDRRLSKTTNDQTTYYLYDNRMEIGALHNNTLTEFRALGIGLGAEIGAAISLELNNTPYVPIHDHRGSTTAILTLSGQTHTTHRYTAFGQTHTTHIPYLFCSKRHDPETNLTYFGRRYYSAHLGRWTTPDPKGYADSSNLYVYALNSPHTRLDLYGELSFTINAQPSPFAGTPKPGVSSSYPLTGSMIEGCAVHLFDNGHNKEWLVRQGCALQGKPYDPENAFHLQQPSSGYVGRQVDSPHLAQLFVNGILNTLEDALDTATSLSRDYMSFNCHYTHFPCAGFMQQMKQCWDMWRANVPCEAVNHLAEKIQCCFNDLYPTGMLVIYAHSAGALITREALKQLPDELRQRIEVYTFGAPDWIERSAAKKVVNYCCEDDPVAGLAYLKHWFGPGSKYDVHRMPSVNKNAVWEHSIRGPTYQTVLNFVVRDVERRYLP